MLDDTTCLALVREHGLMTSDDITVHTLTGGVSNAVFAVTDGDRRVVVKQSMERLRVSEEWRAPVERILTEAAALHLAARLTPDRVPRPLFVDPERFVLAIEGAPTSWRDWRSALLDGQAAPTVAADLGNALATWHTATLDGHLLEDRFFDTEAFEQLRIDPYYRTVARRAPEVAKPLTDLIERMSSRRLCLVHGDFSPKNVLSSVDGTGCWVIDFEVAHFGDPSFDLAFLLSHLTLKALHRPGDAGNYDACVRAFCKAYSDAADSVLTPDWSYVLQHVAGLLLARVRGKSPASYLDNAQASIAWDLGTAILTQRPSSVDDLSHLRARMSPQ
jgi:5-methylthioribose kinase